jgi:peptidoglycan hydrolase-like protein with peptidoglycan-binding domain
VPSSRSFPSRRTLRRLVPVVLGTAGLAAVGLAAPVAVAAADGGTPTSAVTVAPAPSVPRPGVPAGLPPAIEDPSPYVKQVSCDPQDKPGTVALGTLLKATYPGTTYSISRACGLDGIASEHYEGRAVDWFVSVRTPDGARTAAAFIEWLLAPDAAGHEFAAARRLGVMYLIWNDRIWGSYASAAGWRPYSGCANHPEPGWDTRCHRDHLHLSLSWAGAMGVTSFWTRTVAPVDFGPCRPADLNWAAPRAAANPSRCPDHPAVAAPVGAPAMVSALFQYSGAVVGPGGSGPVVRAVQAGLGIGADGRFGPDTAAAVARFRRSQKLPDGNRVDRPTWRALLEVATASPARPAVSGGTTGQAAGGKSAGGRAAGPTGTGQPTTWSPAPYQTLVLTPGTTSPAVAAVQRLLKVSPVSGFYGPLTKAAVVAFQKAHRIPPTGNVGPLTWKALGAAGRPA